MHLQINAGLTVADLPGGDRHREQESGDSRWFGVARYPLLTQTQFHPGTV